MAAVDVEFFITDQLDGNGIPYKLRSKFIDVSCIFHEHSGTKMKLGFSRETGGMSCFGCGKKGHWNDYAGELGLETFGDEDRKLQDFVYLKKEFDRLTEDRTPTHPDWLNPWVDTWRGLSPEFLAGVPSFKWHDKGSSANRILWPVYVNDKFKGCTSARINPNDAMVFPKTRNLGNLDAQKVLFPFDHELVINSKVVILVEGQFDALRLLAAGLPAVSIMGVGTWHRHKLSLLAARGVERLIPAFDGDLAGERVTDVVIEDAKSEFDVRPLYFPNPDEEEAARGLKSIDPGNCKTRYVKLLGRMCRAA